MEEILPQLELYWWDSATTLSEWDPKLSFGPSYGPALTVLVNSECFADFITVRFLSLLHLNLLIMICEKLSPLGKYSRIYSSYICHVLQQDRHRDTWAVDELFVSFNPKHPRCGLGVQTGILAPATCRRVTAVGAISS